MKGNEVCLHRNAEMSAEMVTAILLLFICLIVNRKFKLNTFAGLKFSLTILIIHSLNKLFAPLVKMTSKQQLKFCCFVF